MADPISVIQAAVPIATEVYAILEERGLIRKLADYLNGNKPIQVLVLGCTGAGKSSFLKSLQGDPGFIPREVRTSSVNTIDGTLNDVRFLFYDTPGQQEHRDMRKAAIRSSIAAEHLGVINVVCDGFHEAAGSASDALTNDRPSIGYLRECRSKEIEQLDEWTSLLGGIGGGADWLATVVTKADLWWTPSDYAQILAEYVSGEYARSLGDAGQLKRVVIPYSSCNSLFHGTVRMSGYYTDTMRREHHSMLVVNLLTLVANA
jgi:hypothetical protein